MKEVRTFLKAWKEELGDLAGFCLFLFFNLLLVIYDNRMYFDVLYIYGI